MVADLYVEKIDEAIKHSFADQQPNMLNIFIPIVETMFIFPRTLADTADTLHGARVVMYKDPASHG